MKKNIFTSLVAIVAVITVVAIVQSVLAAEVSYPVAALGNCGSKDECKVYCDTPGNKDQCFRWAEDNGLVPPRQGPSDSSGGGNMSEAEKRLAEEAQANAPGGCKGPEECDAYCSQEKNLNECLDYSVKYGYMPKEEADSIRAKAAAGGPGGCKGPEECERYCRDPKNGGECMSFVVNEGTITQEEADFMVQQMSKGKPSGQGPAEPKVEKEKVAEILKAKTGPGGCKTMEECRNYCMGGEHMDECFKFATDNQIMAPEELEKAKKLSQLGGPGGCKNEKECDAFCSQESNRDTCFNFAKDNGLMSAEEINAMQRQIEIINKMNSNKPSDRNIKEQQQRRQQQNSRPPQGSQSGPSNSNYSSGPNGSGPSYFDMPSQPGGSPAGGGMGMPGNYQNMQPPPGYENMLPPQGMMPPAGMTIPPEGMMVPPQGMTPPANMMPPANIMAPMEQSSAPPPPPPPPSSAPSQPSAPPPPSEPAPAAPTSLFQTTDLLSAAFIGFANAFYLISSELGI